MGAGIQKHQLPGLWVLAVSMDLREDQVASEVDSVVTLMVEEAGEASEEASRTGGATVVAEEEELATKVAAVAEVSHPEVVMVAAEIVVGMEARMDMEHLLLMLQLAQVAHVVVATVVAVGITEEGMEVPAPRIAMVLACQRQLVGMIRVVAVAHMMTDLADIVETVAEAMEIATHPPVVEAVATWSR